MEQNSKANWFARHKVLTVIGGLFLLGIIGSAISGGSKTSTLSPSNSPTNSASSTPTAEPTVDNVPAEYLSAVAKAQSYSDTMNMSKLGIYDQLVSEYGEQFSEAAAQYGIDHVQADWNLNALEKAKSYQQTMNMSPAAIHDQLTSEYGEKFTNSQADYAISHLN